MVEEETDDSNLNTSNPGWADTMSKILKSKKFSDKKILVLSKAKKIQDVKIKDESSTEVENKDEKPVPKIKLTKKEYQLKGRIKPSMLDRDYEKKLMKISTKGVVQLFNVVRNQQKVIDKTLEPAGKSELKREKLLRNINKDSFLNMLTKSFENRDESCKMEH